MWIMVELTELRLILSDSDDGCMSADHTVVINRLLRGFGSLDLTMELPNKPLIKRRPSSLTVDGLICCKFETCQA
jgi:hypothetical protein